MHSDLDRAFPPLLQKSQVSFEKYGHDALQCAEDNRASNPDIDMVAINPYVCDRNLFIPKVTT